MSRIFSIFWFFKIFLKYLDKRLWLFLFFPLITGLLDGIGISVILSMLLSLGNEFDSDSNYVISLILSYTNLKVISLRFILVTTILIFSLKAVLRYIMSFLVALMYKELNFKIKVNFMSAFFSSSFIELIKYDMGHYITVLNVHSQKVIGSFVVFTSLCTSAMMTISYLYIAILDGGFSVIVSMLLMLLFSPIFILLSKGVKNRSVDIASLDKKSSLVALEGLNSVKYLIVTHRYDLFLNEYKTILRSLVSQQFTSDNLRAGSKGIQEIFAVMALVLLLYIQVDIFSLRVSSVVAILALFWRAINQLNAFSSNYQVLQSSQGMVKSYDDALDSLRQFEISYSSRRQKPDATRDITFNNVSFNYPGSTSEVLKKVNFKIKSGTMTALVGVSGSGKSTLTSILTGLLSPTNGYVKLGNERIMDLDPQILGKELGYVGQESILFDDTIDFNITLSRQVEEPNLERLKKVRRIAQIDVNDELSFGGIEGNIGTNGLSLSGGQRQRVLIARELFKDPKILILDEATSGLDTLTESKVINSIRSCWIDITIIIITHSLDSIIDADSFVLISGGSVERFDDYNSIKTALVSSSE